MKILDALLQAEGCETFVALTYGCDLPWFERMLARPLRAEGVRRFLILADHTQLSVALETHLELIRGAGRWYSVEGVQATGSFHPKVYLLTGPDRARLWIGSGNLRVTGLGRNREVFQYWEATTADTLIPAVFEEVRVYIDRMLASLLQKVPQHVADALSEAFGVRVLAQPVVASDVSILGSPTALSTQLPTPPSAAKRLRLVAPFFDDEGRAVAHLADHFQAAEFDVITDVAVTTLTPAAIAAIRQRGGRILSSADPRPLHAKLIHAEGDDWSMSVHGSANLTNRAWHGANAELIVVNQEASAAEVSALIDELETNPLSAIDEDLLQLRASQRAPKTEPAAEAQSLGIESARWLDGDTISITTRIDVTANVECMSGRDVILVEPTLVSPHTLRLVVPVGIDRALPTAVRLRVGDAVGPSAVVHHNEELSEWAKSTSKNEQRLMPLLLGNPDDSELAWLYADVCRRVLLDRAERTAEADEDEDSPKRRVLPKKWSFVRDEDFTNNRKEPEDKNASAEMIDPARLLRRVLFSADDTEDDGDRGVDTEQGDSPDETPPPAKKPITRKRQLEFASVIEKSRIEYLDSLRKQSKRTAEHLLEDLQLLMIGAHRGVRVGALSPRGFLHTVVPTLREFIGGRGRAFALAIRSEPELVADQAWRSWCWSTLSLITYNACLAQYEVSPPDADDLPDPAFPETAPVLWLRNVIVPMGLVPDEVTLEVTRRQWPRLRRLGLWLGDVWPYTSSRVTFDAFTQRMIRDAIAINQASRALPIPLPKLSAVPDHEDVHVVGLGRDGQLAVGFQEGRVAHLRDGAFQREANAEAPWERMHQTTLACPLDHLLGDGDDEKLFEGLDLLRQLV